MGFVVGIFVVVDGGIFGVMATEMGVNQGVGLEFDSKARTM